MVPLAAIAGSVIILLTLIEAFETIILPRRVTRRFRLTPGFYRYTWKPFSACARGIDNVKRRESMLALYGPLSLILLIAVWAAGMIFGFALLQWSVGSTIEGSGLPRSFLTDLYFSGSTFCTLGLGDVTPRAALSRTLTIVEAGMGFGFLALVISYLPVVYGGFSEREVNVALLDGRAGTPPTAAELILRNNDPEHMGLREIFHEWEHSSAELLESHISYPVVGYFRSQHDNQSWVAALTAVLDATALCQVGIVGAPVRQAQLTFAMARHAVVDLAQVFNTPPRDLETPRLSREALEELRSQLANAGIELQLTPEGEQRLTKLRNLYEPYIAALAEYLLVQLPPWFRASTAHDNWKTSRWGERFTI